MEHSHKIYILITDTTRKIKETILRAKLIEQKILILYQYLLVLKIGKRVPMLFSEVRKLFKGANYYLDFLLDAQTIQGSAVIKGAYYSRKYGI